MRQMCCFGPQERRVFERIVNWIRVEMNRKKIQNSQSACLATNNKPAPAAKTEAPINAPAVDPSKIACMPNTNPAVRTMRAVIAVRCSGVRLAMLGLRRFRF